MKVPASLGQFGGIEASIDRLLSIPGAEWIIAAIILVIGYYASGVIVRLLGRRVAQRFRRPSVTRTVLRTIRFVVLLSTVIVALTALGFGFGNIVLSVTVFSAVVGIILAPIAGSIINGLFVLADQPYEVGDLVQLVDINQRGFIEDITLRYTKIFTLDNTFLVLPNSTIRERDVENFSAEDERTRLSLSLLVTYESNIPSARTVMEQAALSTPGVIDGGPDIRIGSARYPAIPRCYIENYADHGVLLTLRYWVKNPYHLMRVQSRVNERVWNNLSEVDVEIAYPHSHLVFDETSGRLGLTTDDGSSGYEADPTKIND